MLGADVGLLTELVELLCVYEWDWIKLGLETVCGKPLQSCAVCFAADWASDMV